VFVYHVQNGRASDLAKVLNAAFGNASGGAGLTDTDATNLSDHSEPTASTAAPQQTQGPANGVNGLPPACRAAPATMPRVSAWGQTGRDFRRGGEPAVAAADRHDHHRRRDNNAIVVFATPRDYALITDALGKLDVPPLQVMIDASISEVTLNHGLQYGLQWRSRPAVSAAH